jgi:hypothetical protein
MMGALVVLLRDKVGCESWEKVKLGPRSAAYLTEHVLEGNEVGGKKGVEITGKSIAHQKRDRGVTESLPDIISPAIIK